MVEVVSTGTSAIITAAATLLFMAKLSDLDSANLPHGEYYATPPSLSFRNFGECLP
jgi:hypothetical protein